MSASSHSEPDYLFVMGCPRSGTSFLGNLLNVDTRIVLGQERFQLIPALIEPFHFTEEVFFNPTSLETRVLGRRIRTVRDVSSIATSFCGSAGEPETSGSSGTSSRTTTPSCLGWRKYFQAVDLYSCCEI